MRRVAHHDHSHMIGDPLRTHNGWIGADLGLAVTLGLSLAVAVLTAAEAGSAVGIDWAEYAAGLDNPIDLAVTGVATDTRLFVAERDGRIKIVLDTGTVLTTPFLDIDDVVDGEVYTEVGLFGLAFDPAYASNGGVYVYYNDLDGDLQLSRYQVSSDPNVALTTEVKLLTIPHPGSVFHNGGNLAFGPDGYLYLGPGDGAQHDNAGRWDVLLGKLLRIEVSGQPTYTVPATNPFTQTAGALPEIWAVGLRNPWRFDFDQLTGDLYIGEVGQDNWEELDRQPAASAGGEHYGWGCYEGTHVFHASPSCPALADVTMPIYEYGHAVGSAITGGYVYRGQAYPFLDGYYFFADFITQQFFALNTATNHVVALGQMFGSGALPVTFGQDASGEIYVADYASGRIYKLVGLGPLESIVYLPLVQR